MSKTIEAIFENGVFKPLQKVDIKEHEQVEIRVIPKGEGGKGFNRLINKIHKKSAQYSPEEIEADISQAIKEVREGKRGR